eukprot:jgi/Mesvir1/21913/Mv01971-RA.3
MAHGIQPQWDQTLTKHLNSDALKRKGPETDDGRGGTTHATSCSGDASGSRTGQLNIQVVGEASQEQVNSKARPPTPSLHSGSLPASAGVPPSLPPPRRIISEVIIAAAAGDARGKKSMGQEPNARTPLLAASGTSGDVGQPAALIPESFMEGGNQPLPKTLLLVLLVALLLAAGITVLALPHGVSDIIRFLSKSGIAAAFSLILVSEIGDKTFFIAALLAMRHSKLLVTVAATAALALMTVISTGLGYLFKEVPHSISSSGIIAEYAAVAMLVYFGVRTLMQGLAMKPKAPKAPEEGEKEEEDEDSELQDAVVLVSQAEESLGGQSSAWAIMAEAFTLVFVAEWGDRSMLATIALGATQSPFGVAAGAIAGHFLATTLAVIGGSVLSRHISERVVRPTALGGWTLG